MYILEISLKFLLKNENSKIYSEILILIYITEFWHCSNYELIYIEILICSYLLIKKNILN